MESGNHVCLILEDDAVVDKSINQDFLQDLFDTMVEYNLDVLQVGYIEHIYNSFALGRIIGNIESILLRKRVRVGGRNRFLIQG